EQEHRELVPAVSGDKVGGSGGLHQGVRYGAEHVVTDGVAEAIVDFLQMQNIEHEKQYAASSPLCAGGQPPVHFMERAPAGQSGERIGGVSRQQLVRVV